MRAGTIWNMTLLVAFATILGCNLCKEEIWQQLPSPDGKWTATVVMRNCGATTSEVVSVNLHSSNSKRLDAGNYVLVVKHGNPGVGWKANGTLKIDCPDCDVISSVNKLGSIQVSQNLPPARR
jgi:hypothetical protein